MPGVGLFYWPESPELGRRFSYRWSLDLGARRFAEVTSDRLGFNSATSRCHGRTASEVSTFVCSMQSAIFSSAVWVSCMPVPE